jgi:hypothetical protein
MDRTFSCRALVDTAMALAAIVVGCSGQPFTAGDAAGGAAGSGGASFAGSASTGAAGTPIVGDAGSGGSATGGSTGSGGETGGSASAGSGASATSGAGGVATAGASGSSSAGGVGINPIGTAGSAGTDNICKDPPCAPPKPSGNELDRSKWRVSASNTYFPNTQAELAIDDDPESCWASGIGQTPGMWFLLDLNEAQFFFEVDVRTLPSSTDYARQLKLSASTDGKHFTPLRSEIAGMHELKISFDSAQFARYLKLEITKDTGGLWWRIDDLRVRN